ncbi:MAG: spore coat protein CotJB [Oscillospiraceae bacterium]|jgi:spore coat protein JB|nr:spore coat protein CotJB [Oscillospiraceae bacterium]
MENNTVNKSALLREIQICQFALIETQLYLDSHPCDQEALRYFTAHREHLKELTARWEKVCGKVRENGSELCWAWTDTPWPWQVEG